MKKISTELYPFHHEVRIRYSETDAQGILFNANYLTLADVAITEYFRFKGMDYKKFVSDFRIDFHVTNAQIKFISPILFDDLIKIYVKPKLEKIRIQWEILFCKQEEILTYVELEYVIMNTIANKPAILPAELTPVFADLSPVKI